ncbi:AMP-dependent synthetase/ligase [Acaryochloris marina]|uniref:Long-chain-fatty-acid--CoA ligase n=1 Tax=Acaryochloris marina (strain MBIC 11017) TaxID=329726 RepID=B0BZV1_ACAM1|nr:AMP-dependent synthetase/ligase [Acaryochloris marina]ABW27161.1 long-chain-fatty-acid--CoA ligase [Acaryochloris marina MBIC11017]BDM81914.1 AMP-dependent synthetase [Acaryochloris marina MBIC10699]
MFTPHEIYCPLPQSEQGLLGRTLPSLLDEACERHPNAQAFNHWTKEGWEPVSSQAFRTTTEEIALGLKELGLEAGDRMAVLMHSDVNFCLADMGSLLAHLINVPIYMGETPENMVFIMQHSGAKALMLSDLQVLQHIAPCLHELSTLKFVIVANGIDSKFGEDSSIELQTTLPDSIQLVSLPSLRIWGQEQLSDQSRKRLRAEISPEDVATIVYVAGATGRCQAFRSQVLPIFQAVTSLRQRLQHGAPYLCELPKGVMLTHENLAGDALAAFSIMPGLRTGPQETVLSFLPLTHVFARVMLYGHLNHGHTVYFTTPQRIVKHIREIRPTILSTVPRLLEKVYQKILERGHHLPHFQQMIFQWAIDLAHRYQLGCQSHGLYDWKLKLADQLVYRQWRNGFGGRLRYLLCGGAALKSELATVLSAAGIPVLQGYGLTQTSAVLCVNRGELNRAGTVGVPIPGVEIEIAPDGEVLAKAPYVMKGYYNNPVATQEAIDAEGWFHTGDYGEITDEGFLTITGQKKSLFKLSTGKYVAPERIEHHLVQSSLVDWALAVGNQRPYCGLLIFPNRRRLHRLAKKLGVHLPLNEIVDHPQIIAEYQLLVDAANQKLPVWSRVKRFRLIPETLTVRHGLLTSSRQPDREATCAAFAEEIEALYGAVVPAITQPVSPTIPPTSASLRLEAS